MLVSYITTTWHIRSACCACAGIARACLRRACFVDLCAFFPVQQDPSFRLIVRESLKGLVVVFG